MQREYIGKEEFIRRIKNMRGGAFVSVGYISSIQMPKTVERMDKVTVDDNGNERSGWDDFESNRSEFDNETYNSINSLKGLGRKGRFDSVGIKGIVKVSQFTTNWQTDKNYKKNSRNLENARVNFLTDHGASIDDITARRKKPKANAENGNAVESNDLHLNPASHTNAKYSYYIIDENGDMSRPLSKKGASVFLSEKGDASLISVLDNVDDADNAKYWYREWCKAMRYNYATYLLNNVLYVVGTIDGRPFFFFNNELVAQVDSSNKNLIINPQKFLEIAEKEAKRLSVNLPQQNKPTNESKNNRVKMTEQQLFNMILETVNRTLKDFNIYL